VQIVNSSGKNQNRYQGGGANGISHILMFYWFEPVQYMDPVSAKTYIQNIIPKFEGFLARILSPSRHPGVKDIILK
jgi:hypothetical protein